MSKRIAFYFSFFLLCLSGSSMFAQGGGFLGKKTMLTGGVSLSTPMFNNRFSHYLELSENEYGSIYYERTLLPPKLSLQAGRIVGGHVLLSLDGSWQGLQNSGLVTREYMESGGTTYGATDTFKLRTNALALNFESRFYSEFAPIGRYVSLSGGITHASAKIYPVYRSQYYEAGSNEFVITDEKKESGISNVFLYNASFGFGRTFMLSRKLVLDYGFKATLYFGDGSRDPDAFAGISYKEQFNDILDFIAQGNLQSSNAFEIYVKFGITH